MLTAALFQVFCCVFFQGSELPLRLDILITFILKTPQWVRGVCYFAHVVVSGLRSTEIVHCTAETTAQHGSSHSAPECLLTWLCTCPVAKKDRTT